MPMRFASCWLFWAALLVLTALAGCGGNSSVTTCKGSDGSYSAAACAATGGSTSTVTLDTPTGSNTTEVIVDAGPASFSMGTANVPFVTVTVCPPNSGPASASACVTIDHIFLDTGSYGLRLLKSGVARLSLPALTLAANAQFNTPGGTAVECYPFVLGGVWGPLAQADVHIAGETATAIPIQVIDDGANPALTPPADCNSAAGGSLFSNAASLQANGILGIGMIPYDCGLTCTSPLNYAGFHIQYYVCPDSVTANCQAAAVAAEQQVQNPLAHFVPDDGNPENPGLADNNGSIISLPALSPVGAGVAKGRLVFGIGTRSNNQIGRDAKTIFADANPASLSYLYFTTTLGQTNYPDSYIDSGSNAYFFDDAAISQTCAGSSGNAGTSGWYCPAGSTPVALNAILTDSQIPSNTAQVNFSIANADTLFSTSSTAFNNLGGSITAAPRTFVWGLSFFFGRSVYTSIWGQWLSTNGPWNAF